MPPARSRRQRGVLHAALTEARREASRLLGQRRASASTDPWHGRSRAPTHTAWAALAARQRSVCLERAPTQRTVGSGPRTGRTRTHAHAPLPPSLCVWDLSHLSHLSLASHRPSAPHNACHNRASYGVQPSDPNIRRLWACVCVCVSSQQSLNLVNRPHGETQSWRDSAALGSLGAKFTGWGCVVTTIERREMGEEQAQEKPALVGGGAWGIRLRTVSVTERLRW